MYTCNSCLAMLDGPSNNFKCILTCKVKEIFENSHETTSTKKRENPREKEYTSTRKEEPILR